MDGHFVQFADYLFTVQNLMIVTAVWIVLRQVRMLLPKTQEAAWYARLLPIFPIVLASGFVWIPGAVELEVTVASRVFLGITLGFLAAHGNKLLKQTLLGKDQRIKGPPQ